MYQQKKMLNTLMMSEPIYSSINQKLLVVDNSNNIFKYNHKDIKNKQISIEIDNLQQSNYSQLLGNKQQQQIDQQLKIDEEIEIIKCSCHIISNYFKFGEIIVLLNKGNSIKILAKVQGITDNNKENTIKNYQLVQINGSLYKEGVYDYYIDNKESSQFSYIYLLSSSSKNLQDNDNSLLKVHKFSIQISDSSNNTYTCVLSQKWINNISLTEEQVKQIANTSNSNNIKLVDNGRMIRVGNELFGVYDKFNIKLPTSKESIIGIQFGFISIIYFDSQCARVYDRKSQQNYVLVQRKQIVGLKYLELDRSFVVATHSPTIVSVYSGKGMQLWTLKLEKIQFPMLVETFTSSSIMILMDRNKHQIYTFTKQSIYRSQPKLNELDQQLKIHQATMITLKHRIQILKTLVCYLNNHNIQSVFRFLNNCNNNSMVNDGLLLASRYLASGNNITDLVNQQQIVTLSFKLLQQSKYESHIENSLAIMLTSCKRVCSMKNNYEIKKWQQYCKILRQIVQNKRVRKLKQQQKNLQIFQLSYQLIYTVNGYIFRN